MEQWQWIMCFAYQFSWPLSMHWLFRSVGYCRGRLCQLPHCLPSMDIYSGYPTLSLLPGIGVCSWLCIWLVVDQKMIQIFVLYGSYPCWGVWFLFVVFVWDYVVGDLNLWWNWHRLRTFQGLQFWVFWLFRSLWAAPIKTMLRSWWLHHRMWLFSHHSEIRNMLFHFISSLTMILSHYFEIPIKINAQILG